MEFPFERKAMNGEPVPCDLDVADTCAYISLSHIYASYKAGLISKIDARSQKEAVVNAWNLHKSQVRFVDDRANTLKERLEEASKRYVLESTVENADKLYAAFWGLRDDWRWDLDG